MNGQPAGWPFDFGGAQVMGRWDARHDYGNAHFEVIATRSRARAKGEKGFTPLRVSGMVVRCPDTCDCIVQAQGSPGETPRRTMHPLREAEQSRHRRGCSRRTNHDRGESMTHCTMQHIPLSCAYLCQDCNCVGNCARQCPACASSVLMNLSGVLDREVEREKHPALNSAFPRAAAGTVVELEVMVA
jgi:hypothetical protein